MAMTKFIEVQNTSIFENFVEQVIPLECHQRNKLEHASNMYLKHQMVIGIQNFFMLI